MPDKIMNTHTYQHIAKYDGNEHEKDDPHDKVADVEWYWVVRIWRDIQMEYTLKLQFSSHHGHSSHQRKPNVGKRRILSVI